MIGISAVWTVAAGYGAFAARHTLHNAQIEATAHRKQTEQLVRDAHQKQATVALADALRVETPDSAGSPEWADTLGRLAQESGVTVDSLRMTNEFHPPTPSTGGAAGTPGANGTAAAPPAAAPANQGSGTVSGAAKDPDDGWKKAKFDCVALGGFRELTAFLDKLDNAPYVLEIAGADMTRDRYDSKTGALRLRLKLTLTLYGMPKK